MPFDKLSSILKLFVDEVNSVKEAQDRAKELPVKNPN